MSIAPLRRQIRRQASPKRAKINQWFFKTGPGEYGEGDRFIGLTLPQIRGLVKQHRDLTQNELGQLLRSPIHEERLLALLVLVDQYRRGDGREKSRIYRFTVKSFRRINNWDLVDCSVEHLIGAHLWNRSKTPLTQWARSRVLWERRIAIVATFYFIRRHRFTETLAIARLLLDDPEDLLHKATGWMLREVGKRDLGALENFLKKHYRVMPRTMLRYAIERFPERRRKAYLLGTIR